MIPVLFEGVGQGPDTPEVFAILRDVENVEGPGRSQVLGTKGLV